MTFALYPAESCVGLDVWRTVAPTNRDAGPSAATSAATDDGSSGSYRSPVRSATPRSSLSTVGVSVLGQ